MLEPAGCDTYSVVQFPAFLQVEVLNMSTVNPININGASVQGQTLLEVGDTIEVLGHRFVWQRQEQQESQNIPDSELEASYQIGEYLLDASSNASEFEQTVRDIVIDASPLSPSDNPTNNERAKSEPRVVVSWTRSHLIAISHIFTN